MRVGLPAAITASISERAAQLARENISTRGWSGRSSGSIQAFPSDGTVGLRTTLDYVMYQNRGIKPFVMWSLEGKIIPMKDADGTRFIRATGVGQPGWVTLPGGVKKWRDQKWKHPGLAPKRFFEDSITAAIKESKPMIAQQMMRVLGGQAELD